MNLFELKLKSIVIEGVTYMRETDVMEFIKELESDKNDRIEELENNTVKDSCDCGTTEFLCGCNKKE